VAYELELQVADYNIRHYTARARAIDDMIEYLTEQSTDLHAQADFWTAERDRYLGQTGLENVVPFPTETGGSVA
jgi:hypothetical protein